MKYGLQRTSRTIQISTMTIMKRLTLFFLGLAVCSINSPTTMAESEPLTLAIPLTLPTRATITPATRMPVAPTLGNATTTMVFTAVDTTSSPSFSPNATTPECINGYYHYPNIRRMGGNRNTGVNTAEKCKTNCNRNTMCWGYTFESEKPRCYVYLSRPYRSTGYQYYYRDVNGSYTTQENQAHRGGLKYQDYMTQRDCQILCDSFPSCTGYTIQKTRGPRKICRLHIFAFVVTGKETHNHYQMCGPRRNGKIY